MPASNQEKKQRGDLVKKLLKDILVLTEQFGYITHIEENYSIGKVGYTDQKQFKAHYLIRFADNTEWILFTTTSIRDRVKQQYWDAFNLKEINPRITSAYLVYPDSIEDNEDYTARQKNEKIRSNGEFSPLEGIISQNEIFATIEEYALRGKTPSQIRDIQGNNFEKRIAAILSHPANIQKWQSDDTVLEGIHYDVFEMLVSCMGLNSSEVVNIVATADKSIIGYLPTGGAPKTDVLVTITDNTGRETKQTISCKRTSADYVSVHQYSANAFALVLDDSNDNLKRLLRAFQEHGAIKDRHGNRYMSEEDELALETELAPLVRKLTEWVMGGIHGAGDPETQWARYIVVYDNNDATTSAHSTEEYCSLLIANETRGNFATPFKWTYQGERGTNIQLKSKVIK
ncbi:MAG: MspI family type II restriction endonuclease [Clostridia bacterium]|nr:MspI family type II restriction endonuclease [Clostridia bacterium]